MTLEETPKDFALRMIKGSFPGLFTTIGIILFLLYVRPAPDALLIIAGVINIIIQLNAARRREWDYDNWDHHLIGTTVGMILFIIIITYLYYFFGGYGILAYLIINVGVGLFIVFRNRKAIGEVVDYVVERLRNRQS